jgi:AraC-like DNA-binding protein
VEPRREQNLLDLVVAHTPHEGRHESVQPGLSFWRRDRPSPPLASATFSLVLAVIVQGKKAAHFDGRTYAYDPLHYLVFTGESEFTSEIIEASPDRPYLSVGLAMPPELVARTLLALADQGSPAGRNEDSADEPAFVAPLAHDLHDALCRFIRASDDPIERTLIAPLVLEEIVVRLLRSDAAARLRRAVPGDDAARIQDTMAFIRAHAGDRLSVDELARRVAMSPSHFAHRFRAVACLSPMRYVKHVRLHEARLLLLQGARASQAADQVGYASASHFTRDFKAYFGVPPAEYGRRIAGSGKPSAAAGMVASGPAA